MKILTINCGSSTLKYRLVDVEASHPRGTLLPSLVDDVVEGLGADRSYADAVAEMLEHVSGRAVLGLDAIACRVVHGGDMFIEPTLVDDAVLRALEGLSGLAPLHNRPALEAMKATRSVLGADTPAVAVFDTAFHYGMPPRAAHYAVRRELAERHGIRRFGFHGLAHRWMSERFATRVGADPATTLLVTLQLGNGCSAAAIDGGRSIDTTMGLTPLEGLMMGTRSGDVDPYLVAFLAEEEGVGAERVIEWLNHDAGLLGVSGRSADMRDLLAAEAGGDERAALAVEMFCYRVRKVIGAYDAALGGASAIVFGGGIGERSPVVRSRICSGLEHLGVRVDMAGNESALGTEATISTDDSTLSVEVLPVDEGTLLAVDAARLLSA